MPHENNTVVVPSERTLYYKDEEGNYIEINKTDYILLKPQSVSIWELPEFGTIEFAQMYDACKACENNKINGGSGICCCTLPYIDKTASYSVKTMIETSKGAASATYTVVPD